MEWNRSFSRAKSVRRRHGFTLIELVAVIVVLAILGAVAFPRYYQHTEEARMNSARNMRGQFASLVILHQTKQVVETGIASWPADLSDVLDSSQSDQYFNPWRLSGQPVYDTDGTADPTKFHMVEKTIEGGAGSGLGAIWYNPMNGAVRFRVRTQSTPAATMKLYNRVNACSVTSLSQTTP